MKTHFSILLFLLMIMACVSNGQSLKGEGPVVTRQVSIDPITGVSLGFSGDLILRQGPQQIEISAQENLIPHLKTEVKDGIWKADFDRNIKNAKDIKVYVTLPDLTHVFLSGSGSIVSDGSFRNLGELDMKLSGSGDIDFNAQVETLNLKVSGSGDVKLSGSAVTVDLMISGSGDIDAFRMEAKEVSVKISGSGDVGVHATDQLDAAVSGSGDVEYKGSPRVNARVSGSGEVTSRHM